MGILHQQVSKHPAFSGSVKARNSTRVAAASFLFILTFYSRTLFLSGQFLIDDFLEVFDGLSA